jgi:hypothetical protein
MSVYQTKVKELLVKFTQFLVDTPDFAAKIPFDAQVVLLDANDPVYSNQAIEYAQRAYAADDKSNRPLVYIDVNEIFSSPTALQGAVALRETPPQYITNVTSK